MNIKEFLDKLSDKKIVSFGETHHGQHTVFFRELSKHLSNIDGVFLEKPISDQKSIDYYVNSGEFDGRMLGFIEGAKKEGKDIKETLQTILNYGRDLDKPIVAIDSSKTQNNIYNNKSTHGYYFHKGLSREEDMYTNILNRYRQNELWVLICGARHLEMGRHHRSGVETLGTRLKKHFGDDFARAALVTNTGGINKIQSVTGYFTKDRKGAVDSYLAQFDGYIITPQRELDIQ